MAIPLHKDIMQEPAKAFSQKVLNCFRRLPDSGHGIGKETGWKREILFFRKGIDSEPNLNILKNNRCCTTIACTKWGTTVGIILVVTIPIPLAQSGFIHAIVNWRINARNCNEQQHIKRKYDGYEFHLHEYGCKCRKKTLRDGYKSADAGLTPDTQAINKKPGKPLARAARPGNQSWNSVRYANGFEVDLGVSSTSKPHSDSRFGFLLLMALNRFLLAFSISIGFDELLILPFVFAMVTDISI